MSRLESMVRFTTPDPRCPGQRKTRARDASLASGHAAVAEGSSTHLEPATREHEGAVVRDEHDQGALAEGELIHGVEHASHAIVERREDGEEALALVGFIGLAAVPGQGCSPVLATRLSHQAPRCGGQRNAWR